MFRLEYLTNQSLKSNLHRSDWRTHGDVQTLQKSRKSNGEKTVKTWTEVGWLWQWECRKMALSILLVVSLVGAAKEVYKYGADFWEDNQPKKQPTKLREHFSALSLSQTSNFSPDFDGPFTVRFSWVLEGLFISMRSSIWTVEIGFQLLVCEILGSEHRLLVQVPNLLFFV